MGQTKLSQRSGGLSLSTLSWENFLDLRVKKTETLRSRGRHMTRGQAEDQTFYIEFAVTYEATKTESRARGKDPSSKEQWLREIVVFKAFHFCCYVSDWNYLSFKTVITEAVFQ